MVVSFDIHLVLGVIELICCLVLLVLTFVFNKKTWSRVTRLILTSILVFINVAQLPMEVLIGKSYGLTIASIVIWFLLAIYTTFSIVLGDDD